MSNPFDVFGYCFPTIPPEADARASSVSSPTKMISFGVQFEDENSLLTNRLSAFISALAYSSSQLVYEQLCRATKAIVIKGNVEPSAVVFPIIGIHLHR